MSASAFSQQGDVTLFHKAAASRRSSRKALLIFAIAAAVALAACAVAGALCQSAAMQTDFSQKDLPPSWAHPFGTDWLGRDMLLRTLAGLALSSGVGLLATLCSSVIALGLAMLAAWGGKAADAAVSWLTDLMLGIPHIVLLILISFALGKGAFGVAAGIALTHWPSLTRVLRAEILQSRASGAVAVAAKLGQGRLAIARNHLLPALVPQFFVGVVLTFPHAVLHEASVTFLGFGLPPDIPSIGGILSESMGFLAVGDWWLAVFPGLALIAVVALFYGLGASLRQLLDPHRAQR